jgi:putative addiction module killer protein
MNIINQTEVFENWLECLKDSKGKTVITARIRRAAFGNFGDHKFLRDEIYEMRITVGAGYRVYYAKDGNITYLLLCGGDKSTQKKDIDKAVKLWKEIKNGQSDAI